MSEQVFDLWFACDRLLDEGDLVIERFTEEQATDLAPGETRYLEMLRASSMRLYEIADSSPGESLTLRDLIEGDRITVHERLGSRSLHRHEWVAARVVAVGASGRPEIEGILGIPNLLHHGVRDQLQLRNTDGEEMVITHVLFDVLDRRAVVAALGEADALEGDEGNDDLWRWSGNNAKGEPIRLGLLKLRDETLTLETNSIARGERGRALVEGAAGASVRHRGTTHEDLQRAVRDDLRSGREEPSPDRVEALPFEVQEALLLDHHARYYRSWLDLPLPALDDQTPRNASRDAALRPTVAEMLHDLDGMYQRALRAGTPAFDPSWLWHELGLEVEALPHPPPLAHERIAQLVPGSSEICLQVAEAARRQPGFDDASSVFTAEDARTNIVLQRFLREREASSSAPALASHLELLVSFDLHRRKSFWVDESLAYMLAHTDLDVRGEELRVPFPSFALVFTDRHVLSLAERHLARQPGCPLAGEYLRVATVYVTEIPSHESRVLRVAFALDALGADPPFVVTHRIPVGEEDKVERYLDNLAPAPKVEPAVPAANPLRALFSLTINAILYATSAGVEPRVRPAPSTTAARSRLRGGPPVTFSSDEVYFLPGAIEISQIRRMQDLERVSDGRTILRRFMVRGHWRRAAAGWDDQRMRWIQPHWKGPDMAAIIERTYKLKP